MIKIGILIILITLAYFGWSSLERRCLYFPDREIVATPAVYRMTFDDVGLRTQDAVRIRGWFIPGARSPHSQAKSYTLLFCHGNAGNISHRLDKLQIFHHLGLNVLLFDYRGYGQSDGVPSEAGTYADADAAYRYLTETQRVPSNQIILYGESLGCAVATEMACHHSAAALILESPFTSTLAMAKRIFPWLPVRWIVRYDYDNLSKIPHIKMPILIMHSPQDDIVPFEMGQTLFAAAHKPKKFLQLTGDHNEGYAVTGPRYAAGIQEFIGSLTIQS